MYRVIKDHGIVQCIEEIGEAKCFPAAAGNPDYDRYQEWVSAGNTAQEIDFAYTPESAKDQVISWAANARVQIAGTSDSIEIAAWNNKLRIAKAVLSGSATPSDIESVSTEASLRGRGESVNDLCQKIVNYSAQYAIAVATVDGLQKQALEAIEGANSPTEIKQVLDGMLAKAEAAMKRLTGQQT